eukprot:ctg_4813.g669
MARHARPTTGGPVRRHRPHPLCTGPAQAWRACRGGCGGFARSERALRGAAQPGAPTCGCRVGAARKVRGGQRVVRMAPKACRCCRGDYPSDAGRAAFFVRDCMAPLSGEA